MTLIDLPTRSWRRVLFEVPSMPSRSSVVFLFLSCAALLPLAACGSSGNRQPDQQASAQLTFGVDMARQGLWKEALFRFTEAEKLDPNNPRVHSNLGVAYEASGQFEKALSSYQKALQLAPNDKGIRANYSRFVEFYQGYKGEKKAGPSKPATTTTATTNRTAPPPPTTTPAAPPRQPGVSEPPSIPGDTPPPPADSRPPF
ncbi:MAG TPA: tetratricopeptide repeat protein [Thermoanaerobaculia bacterium]